MSSARHWQWMATLPHEIRGKTPIRSPHPATSKSHAVPMRAPCCQGPSHTRHRSLPNGSIHHLSTQHRFASHRHQSRSRPAPLMPQRAVQPLHQRQFGSQERWEGGEFGGICRNLDCTRRKFEGLRGKILVPVNNNFSLFDKVSLGVMGLVNFGINCGHPADSEETTANTIPLRKK